MQNHQKIRPRKTKKILLTSFKQMHCKKKKKLKTPKDTTRLDIFIPTEWMQKFHLLYFILTMNLYLDRRISYCYCIWWVNISSSCRSAVSTLFGIVSMIGHIMLRNALMWPYPLPLMADIICCQHCTLSVAMGLWRAMAMVTFK